MRVGIITALFFLTLVPKTWAATISHSTNKSEVGINEDIELETNLTIQAGDGNEYFLRGVIYKPGSNNYCGFTWNGTGWFSGPYSTQEQWKNFQKISITNNSWNGKVKIKIDQEDKGCKDSGAYKVKIQRFTLSGAGTFDDQNETSLYITVPTSTPTITPTQANTPTPKITKAPTQTPTLKTSATTNKNTTETVVLKSTMSDEENIAKTKEILGSKNVYENKTKSTVTPKNLKVLKSSTTSTRAPKEPSIEEDKTTGDKTKSSTFIYIGGFCLIMSCGILLYQTYRNRNEQ